MAPLVLGASTRHRHRLEARGGEHVFAKLAEGESEAEELRREAGVLALLGRRLPETARLAPASLGWSDEDGALYLEAIEGEDLGGRVLASGRLDLATAAALGTALAVLHEEGRAARDGW